MELSVLKIVIFLAGCLSGYFIAYSKKKGENKALLEDIRQLEQEKRSVETDFVLKIEEVKKQHNLEFERRKYQYEEKSRVYSDFCSELDRYQSKGQVILKEQAMPMISRFLKSLEASNDSENLARISFSEYFSDVLLLCNELSLAFIEMKNQTNKLRLVTSEDTDLLLTQLTDNLQKLNDVSIEMMKFIATPEGMIDPNKQQQYTKCLVALGDDNQVIRNDLIQQMKAELTSS
ncbi:hypothetical protein [Vibrio sp. Evd11]|uniref:hypothetical protein n=1 Tax=Vibrio sp. Evd11 TaxID=1207404 RepID=UPI000EFB4E8F|nr:hypothetical protein [Vibrio sp. Evd11]